MARTSAATRASALAVVFAAARAQWACPSTTHVPPAFLGAFPLGAATVSLTPSSVFLTRSGAAVADARCVEHAFVNPNNAAQVFLTFGNDDNAANDTETGCAFVDLSTPSSVLWAESLTDDPCPLSPSSAAAGGAWSTPAPPPAPCPARAPVPPALRGVGALPDPSGSAPDGLLEISAAAWSNVTAGSFSAPACVVRVADAGAGVSALTLSARADGRAEAWVWARPGADGKSLDFKRGAGAACPTTFAGAAAIPFAFAASPPASAW
jgi:hypothetical protein